jgi:choline dehydrogenase-like flavoprotein
MRDDPYFSVADRDLKVHGLRNFFVVDRSASPIAGVVWPTLMVIALAHRLADHLRGQSSPEALISSATVLHQRGHVVEAGRPDDVFDMP